MERLAREVVARAAGAQAGRGDRAQAPPRIKRVAPGGAKAATSGQGTSSGVVAAVRAVGVLVDIPTPFGTYRAQLKPDQVTGVTRTPLQSFVAEAFPVGSRTSWRRFEAWTRRRRSAGGAPPLDEEPGERPRRDVDRPRRVARAGAREARGAAAAAVARGAARGREGRRARAAEPAHRGSRNTTVGQGDDAAPKVVLRRGDGARPRIDAGGVELTADRLRVIGQRLNPPRNRRVRSDTRGARTKGRTVLLIGAWLFEESSTA